MVANVNKKGDLTPLTLRNCWSHPSESNRRPTDYESVALPTELGWQVGCPGVELRGSEPLSYRRRSSLIVKLKSSQPGALRGFLWGFEGLGWLQEG